MFQVGSDLGRLIGLRHQNAGDDADDRIGYGDRQNTKHGIGQPHDEEAKDQGSSQHDDARLGR